MLSPEPGRPPPSVQARQAGLGPAPADASPQLTSLSLLERVRAHDSHAWQRLLALYRPLVLFWCRRSGLGAEDAEDVAQEVFAGAAAGLGCFHRDRPGDTFRGWLRGITRNQVLLFFRRNEGRPRAQGGSDAFQLMQAVADPLPPLGEDEQQETNQLYQRAVELIRDRFEPNTWQAFWLTVIEGRAPAVLTEELGMTVTAIRQAKSRVLRLLKQELGELLN